MTYLEFSILLANEITKYVICLIAAVLLYYLLFRKKIISLFDPFSWALIWSVFGFSVVLFLKSTENIDNFYFYQYFFSQFAFFLGFFINNKGRCTITDLYNKIIFVKNQYFYIYIIVSLMFICGNLITYRVAGIPIFAKSSRLEFAKIGGGFGIFNRINVVFRSVCAYLSFYFFFSSKKNSRYKIFSCFILSLCILFAILSGGKSGILSIIQILFLFSYINRNEFGNLLLKIKKHQISILVFAIIMAILVIIIQSNGNLVDSFNALLFRLVSSGDAYYFAYPNKVIELLSDRNLFIILFGDLLQAIRILPAEYRPPGMGIELYKIVIGGKDIIGGPNSRHNIYGYVHFGFFGGLLFSFFCGFVLNIIRNMLLNLSNCSQDKKILVLLLYVLCACVVETDSSSAIMGFNNIILLFPIIIIANNILKRLRPSK